MTDLPAIRAAFAARADERLAASRREVDALRLALRALERARAAEDVLRWRRCVAGETMPDALARMLEAEERWRGLRGG